jgi:predicted outer membrane repeat protein
MTDAGGAIMVDGGKLTVIGATFKENQALKGNGGAIGTSRNTSTAMNIKSCSFIGNVAYNNGGAIYIQNGVENNNIVIDGCSFTNNTSTNKTGSAVYVRTSSSAAITNVTCSGGTDSYGDAFYFTGGAKVVLGGTVSVSGDKFYATGSGTTITVNYKTAEEKTAWQGVITTVSSAKISYVDASGDQ